MKTIEPLKSESLETPSVVDNSLRTVGWTGFGLVALCGICCSVPFLAGGLVAGGSVVAVLGAVAWPLAILAGIGLVLAGLFFWFRRRKLVASGSCQNTGGSCAATGTCGCKK